MKKIIFICLFLLQGCASTQYVYQHNNPQANWNNDEAMCKAFASGNAPIPNQIPMQGPQYTFGSGMVGSTSFNYYSIQHPDYMANAQNAFGNMAQTFSAIAQQNDLFDTCIARLGWRKIPYEDAMKQRQQIAQNVISRYNEGVQYLRGTGVPQDYAKAHQLFEETAKLGYVPAMYNLGTLYAIGKGGPKDYDKAKELFEKVINKGDNNGYFGLGMLYFTGWGVPQDYAKAKEYFEIAADHGNTSAQQYLGSMYAEGKGGKQDFIKAKEYFEKSADKGNAESQFWLAVMYAKGNGVTQNFSKAKELLEKSAAQNFAMAQFGLGLMYSAGEGMQPNKAKAKEYFKLACDNGFQDGCNFLKKLGD